MLSDDVFRFTLCNYMGVQENRSESLLGAFVTDSILTFRWRVIMFIKSDICGAEEAQTVSVFNSLFLIERAEKAMFNVTKCKEGSDHNFIVYSYTDLGLILMLITVTASETKILARAIAHDPHNLGNNKDLEEDVGHEYCIVPYASDRPMAPIHREITRLYSNMSNSLSEFVYGDIPF